MEQFRLHLCGVNFLLLTDHKPLVSILGNPRSSPSARIERLALRIQQYRFVVQHTAGSSNPADYLSRHPVPETKMCARIDKVPNEYVNFIQRHNIPKAFSVQVADATKADQQLQSLISAIQHPTLTSWVSAELKPFASIKTELTTPEDIVLRGTRLVLPATLQKQAVLLAHKGHQGIVETKQMLREKVWFPGMDKLVHTLIKSCLPCQAAVPQAKQEPLAITELPSGPWEEVSVDLCGPFPDEKYAMVVLDDFSRYPVVQVIHSTSANNVLPSLRQVFCQFGIPAQVKSDNGPPFQANDIDGNQKKRATLCSVCGPATYAIIRSLCSPDAPSAVAYDEIVRRLSNHFSPRPSVTVQRFKFGTRQQQPGESIADYIEELRRLSEHCDFGASLDDMLRDRLVCGVRSETLQRRLLAELELTFATAREKAIAMESAQRQTEQIRGGATSSEVCSVSGKRFDPCVTKVSAPVTAKEGTQKQAGSPGSTSGCFRCKGAHSPSSCPFINVQCHFCKQRGHIVRACSRKATARASAAPNSPNGKRANGGRHKNAASDVYDVFVLSGEEPAVRVEVRVNGSPLEMEVDSGAVCSVINGRTMRKLRISKRALRPSSLHFRAYNNKELRVLGELTVTVEFRGQEHRLRLVVVKGASIGLIGRDWFKSLGISLSGVHSVCEPSRTGSKGTTALLKKYSSVFEPGLGTSKEPLVRIEVNPAAPPRFLKQRQVPFALRPKVDEALDRLVSQGIFQPVRHSKWATPVVPVVKKDGSIRICGDYKSTVNRVVQWETYPLPTPEQLFARLAGCSKFSKLDLGQAYQQKTVDEETADLLTVTTHRGLFRVTRLQFGGALAVAIFQRYMEELLHGIDGVLVFLDDILIGGRDEAQHYARLQEVLKRIHEDGVQPTEDKVRAIHDAPEPTCKKELQAFLGALNFYKFLKGAAHTLEPLYRLLDKGREWRWTRAEADAFRKAKDLLQSSHVLVHYDVNRPLVLACDASPYGLDAVLSHVGEDGSERPVAYASRTMSAAERKYAQTDREALAIGFGVKKYYKFLYGRHFKIVTDHKPLLGLLHHAKPIPQVLSPRMLRWTLMLSAYDYEIEYRPAEKLSNADAFSRLPLRASKTEEEEQRLWEVGMLEMAPEVTWNSRKVASFTSRDKLLARVCNSVQHGWSEGKLPEEFAAFVIRKHELSVYQGCLLWGSRVVIPEPARPYVMDILHTAHPGIVKMKGLARPEEPCGGQELTEMLSRK
ncbi:uncharacterized protein LOC142583754 [Dermacentor variabilis]|uniref:uncharacterized protein LOC142583754 n=1 Tax=Dermacentor variabilis TaxID=34621 RepID=UPI003F5C958B